MCPQKVGAMIASSGQKCIETRGWSVEVDEEGAEGAERQLQLLHGHFSGVNQTCHVSEA